MRILQASEFDEYWRRQTEKPQDPAVRAQVEEILAGVRAEGDEGVKKFARHFDKSSPESLEVPREKIDQAYARLRGQEPELAGALALAAKRIRAFADRQKEQFENFTYEIAPGVLAEQRVVPVSRAGVYVPGGRFPLISSALMGVIPALAGGVPEVMLASPPLEDGFPDWRILGAGALAGVHRVFAVGGAQAIGALAFGTESIPRADVIVGPGNKYVALAKQLLFGAVGLDFVAGPTDVLVISDGKPDWVAADLLAQAEHDPEAKPRALLSSPALAEAVLRHLEEGLAGPAGGETARASLAGEGLLIVSPNMEESIRIADILAPEHLELHVADPEPWVSRFRNYGSLFIGSLAGEVLGDYSAGLNHTLPTSGTARFSGGLSVRHFLKTLTALRCSPGTGFTESVRAAEHIALAEGLPAHRKSAGLRAPGGV
ncbi:MAG: histidinol dehydrogenase [Spirochaetaceae bacterium]|jgi:histidinol dehydrogenase|nr:histidinol dehydrogenase [Spirochaetaceae bacterium]